MKRFSLCGVCTAALRWLSVIVVLMLLLLNFIFQARVSYGAAEAVSITVELVPSLLMLLLLVACLFLWGFLKRYVERLDPRVLFRILSLLYIAMAVYLVLNVDDKIRADAGTVFRTAAAVMDGDYGAFEPGGYMDRYPHQVGLMLYDGFLQLFSPFPRFSFVMNFCFVLGINYCVMRIADEMFGDRTTTVLAVLLSFIFLPQFFFILFAYGLTPGFFFMTLSFYHTVRACETRRVRNMIAALLAASVAVCFKQNFLIGVIAIGIYAGLRALREKGRDRLKLLLMAVVLAVTVMLPSKLIVFGYGVASGTDMGGGTPSVLWIAMGTDIQNTKRAPGWYNGYNYGTYTASGFDAEKASEMGMEKLKSNFSAIKENPSAAARFFAMKTVSQWCEPMFQSVWSGPLEDCGQQTHTPLLRSIYTGGIAERAVALVAEFAVLWVFGCTFLFLILDGKRMRGWELLLMFLIGGLLFHTFWEGKSQYIYPYVFTLIPVAAHGFRRTASVISKIFERGKRHASEQNAVRRDSVL